MAIKWCHPLGRYSGSSQNVIVACYPIAEPTPNMESAFFYLYTPSTISSIIDINIST